MDFLIPNKLHSPYHSAYVEREQLSDRILAHLDRKLTLVSAPAGFGKTYLALEVAAKSERQAKWYVLDENDASFKTFLTYLEATLFADEANLAATTNTAEEAAATLSKRLYDKEEATLLILDGFDYIDNATDSSKVVQLVDRLIAYLPPNCHILLTSRTQTSLNLAKMLVRQEVNLVNERDLAFSTADIEQLGQKLGMSAEPKKLFKATKGWPAAVSLSLNTGLQSHSANVIGDYIKSELFSGLKPEEEQAAYLVALAPSLSSREISVLGLDAHTLRKLEREHRLLTTDGDAYAFQPLLREGVLEYLKRDRPAVWVKLNEKLGKALWENGFNEGLVYLAKAGSAPLAEALKSINFNTLPGNVWQSLTPWLDSISEDDLEAMPLMMVLKADSIIFKDPEKALGYYETALASSELAGEARAAGLVGRLRAVEKIPSEKSRLESLALEAQAELEETNNLYHLARVKSRLAGNYERQRNYSKAEALYLEIEATAKTLNDDFLRHIALYGLSSLYLIRGKALTCVKECHWILDYQRSRGHHFGEAMTLCVIAIAHQMIGQASVGETHVRSGIQILKDTESKVNLVNLLFTLFSIQCSLDKRDAEQTFLELQALVPDKSSLMANYSYVIKAQLHLSYGELDKVRQYIEKAEKSPPDNISRILRGKLLLTKGLLAAKENKKDEAAKLVLQAVNTFEKAGDRREEAIALKVMLHLTNKKLEATTFTQKIAAIEKDIGYKVPLYTFAKIFENSPKKRLSSLPLITLRTLGKVEMSIDEEAVAHSAWNGKKPKELFLFLASFPSGASRDTIIEAIWSEQELRDPEQQFSIALSRARKALGGRSMIVREGKQYMLGDVKLNHDALTLLKTKSNADYQAIHSALELYRGGYLEGYYTDWIQRRRMEIEETFLSLVSELLARSPVEGLDIHPFVKQAIMLDPANASFNSFLLKFYMNSGKRGLARNQLDNYSESLRELGATPDPTLESLLN